VVSGFSCGIGGMMLVSQLDIILGISSPLTKSSASTVSQLISALERLGDVRWVPLLLGVIVIGVAMAAARVSPRIPAPLLGVPPSLANRAR
jgi:MFS superfamily sulfate permease-like transporter